MNLDPASIIQNPLNFFWTEFYPALIALEPSALIAFAIALIVLFVLIVIAAKFFAWVLSLLKRFILFLIVAASLIVFFLRYRTELLAQPPNYTLVAVGAIGLVFAFVALAISLASIKRHWTEANRIRIGAVEEEIREAVEEELEEGLAKAASAAPAITPTQVQQPQMFTKQALHPRNIMQSFHDRSLLAVLSYIIVAEFGVFSSMTVSAPSPLIGLGLFAAFMAAAFIFMKTSYHDYSKGVQHLAIGTVFGIALSIALGYLWVATPLNLLLSLEYFATNSLVAFITGLAVSLFMGSKG